MDHLEEYERSKGKKWDGEEVERNNKKVVQCDVFVCGVCQKVCRSKAGLSNHKRRMHEVSALKKEFVCGKCGKGFKQEANLSNHKKHSATCRVNSPIQARVYK